MEKSLEAILSLDFYDVKSGSTSQKAKYGGEPVACLKDGCWSLNPQIVQASPDFLRLFKDAVETGLFLAKEKDPAQDFTLYAAYDRKEVCRLLNWPLDVSRPMYGYRLSGNVCPVFITYQKLTRSKEMPAMTTRHAASAWPGIPELPATCLPRKSSSFCGGRNLASKSPGFRSSSSGRMPTAQSFTTWAQRKSTCHGPRGKSQGQERGRPGFGSA